MQRPLAVDYASVNVTKKTNPFSVYLNSAKVSLLGARVFQLLPGAYSVIFTGDAVTTGWIGSALYSVPAVMHSMWRSPEGDIGLALVNWTNANADWIATFNPSRYGITPPYDIVRVGEGGAETVIDAGIGAGDRTIGNAGGPATNIGTIGPFSVQILQFNGS
jgi:hypothetical protein